MFLPALTGCTRTHFATGRRGRAGEVPEDRDHRCRWPSTVSARRPQPSQSTPFPGAPRTGTAPACGAAPGCSSPRTAAPRRGAGGSRLPLSAGSQSPGAQAGRRAAPTPFSLSFPPAPGLRPLPGRSGQPTWRWRRAGAGGAPTGPFLPRALGAGGWEPARCWGAGGARRGRADRRGAARLLTAADSGAGAVPPHTSRGRPPPSAQDHCPETPPATRTARWR